MQQKVQFLGTIVHDPEVLILDEPFSGLDPINVVLVKDFLVDFKKQGKTIVFSTHVMEQAEKLCDRIALIYRGRKLLDGTVKEIKSGLPRPGAAPAAGRAGAGAREDLHQGRRGVGPRGPHLGRAAVGRRR